MPFIGVLIMAYINRKDENGNIETVEDLKGLPRAEKLRLLAEYRLSDKYAHYYISQRASKYWYNSMKEGV